MSVAVRGLVSRRKFFVVSAALLVTPFLVSDVPPAGWWRDVRVPDPYPYVSECVEETGGTGIPFYSPIRGTYVGWPMPGCPDGMMQFFPIVPVLKPDKVLDV